MPGRNKLCALLLMVFTVKILLLVFMIPFVLMFSPVFDSYNFGNFEDQYHLIANNLLYGNGYKMYADASETAIRTPGFPALLSVLFRVFGQSLIATQILNSLFSLGTACCVYFMCRRWIVSETAAAVSALVVFFHPEFLAADSRCGVESLLAFSIMLLIVAIYRAVESEEARKYFLVGLLFGWAMMVRSTIALFPVYFFPYLWLRGFGVRKTSYYLCLLMCGSMLVMAPWVVRNYIVFDAFVPTMTMDGLAAYQGQYFNKKSGAFVTTKEIVREAVASQEKILLSLGLPHKGENFFPQFFNPKHEIYFSTYLKKMVMKEYWHDPLFFAKSCIKNFIGFWVKSGTAFGFVANSVLTLPLLIMALLGCYHGYRQKLKIGVACLFVVFFFLPHIVIMGRPRFHTPILPLLICLATIGVSWLVDGEKAKSIQLRYKHS